MNDKTPAAKRSGNHQPHKPFNKQGHNPGQSETEIRAKLEAEHPGLNVRLCAAKLLHAVVAKNTSLDGLTDAHHGHPHYMELDERDRSLVRAILGTALRNRNTIETALCKLLDRPLPANAVALQQLLHVGAAQILYLDVPDHAAVDIAVTSANIDPRNRKYASLVNAVLRRLTRNKDRAVEMKIPNGPEWYIESLTSTYGREKAEAILAIQAHEPSIDLTVKSDPALWAEKLGGTALPNGSVRLGSFEGSLTALEGFATGDWWVQDAAASLPATLLGDIKGKRVADLCAAPGGKTAQLIMAGAEVTAFDINKNRLKRLKTNLDRLQLSAELIATNILDYQTDELFDAILLDAPCSSTGTVRRHPDVLWTKTPEDITRLSQVQLNLLRHAVQLVKPDGIIVFSNCSLNREEGEDMVEMIINEGILVPAPFKPEELKGMEQLITDQGFLRSTPADLPHDEPKMAGLDGFFAARFRRPL
ncbi:RsmB/NOP family class I SAM-dependent RNA methyltransferase [Pseudochrobactrum sp. MP213Fo]|uniref:RsmB/NOP family class I SAM-dependent RNA methyltransferase n=1 Tax=Pseudochrobactrum sp. MP213Fo TaxID=3022250 RepID=UPI003B9FE7F3